jgi:hypothetical protein
MNRHHQVTVRKTDLRSAQHPFATLTLLYCGPCGNRYMANSCDVHLRRCPSCQGGRPANTAAEGAV